MKFNKLALALFTLAAGAAAHAQSAPTTSVTLYGVADAYGQYAKGANNLYRVQSGGLSGSRFGVRGTEDLGGGLRAFFALESGINLDTGSVGQNGVFWGRQAFVGIGDSSIGQVSFGRQYSSIYNLSSDFSVFSNVATGASTAVIGGFGGYEPVSGNTANAGFDGGPARVNNSVKLESANYGGFRGGAMVGLGEAASGAKNTRIADVYGRYTAGPFDAMLSVVDDKAAANSLQVRTTSAAAAYRFGDARVTAGVMSVNDRSTLNRDGQGAWIGGDYRVGASLFKAQYVRSQNKGSLADGKTQAIGGGYQYDLSKRTSLYSTLTYFKNEGVGYTNRWAGGNATSAATASLTSGTDRNITEVVAGIRHVF